MKNHSLYILVLQIVTIISIGGVSYSIYLNKSRIRATQRLLLETEGNIANINSYIEEMKVNSEKLRELMKPQKKGIEKGSDAPDFTLLNENDKEVSLNHYLGQKVLLVFSQPECVYCKEFYPVLSDYTKYSKDVQVLVLQSNSSSEENRLLKKKQNLNVPILMSNAEVIENYKIEGTPTSILISQKGEIVDSKTIKNLEELQSFVNQT